MFQWTWLEDLRADRTLPEDVDQFNSLHERLIARWRDIVAEPSVHLACMDNTEDRVNIEYLADCANQAGLDPHLRLIGDLGIEDGRLVDRRGRRVQTLFKLYPWEWTRMDGLPPSVPREHSSLPGRCC